MSKIIAVLDLGSSKIAAALAVIRKDGSFALLGLEHLNSRGISKSEVVNIDKSVEDVASIIKRLEKQTGRRIKHIHVTTKAGNGSFLVSRGMIPLSKTPREITKKDIKKCLSMAEMVKLPLNKAIVQKLTKRFYIDDISVDGDYPVGLYGIKLEAEVFIITLGVSKIQNITKCIDHAGYLNSGLSLSSIASALGVLEDNEKETGALLIDIGESISEALGFKNNMLKSYKRSEKGASFILSKDGNVDSGKRNSLLKELYQNLSDEDGTFSSVVVTGGGALIDGVVEEAEKVFNVPARIGMVKNAGRNLNSQDAIIHTATIGIIEQKAKEYMRDHMHKNPLRKLLHKIFDIYESYF